MKNIKSFVSGLWQKVKPYFYALLTLAILLGCLFLVFASVTGLWNSLGETVQQWVAGGVAFYVAISVLGFCGSILVIVGAIAAYSALIAWLNS